MPWPTLTLSLTMVWSTDLGDLNIMVKSTLCLNLLLL